MNIDQAFSYIQHSVRQNRMAQAYVVEAPPRGAGHELACRIFSLLFSDDKALELACTGKHADVHWIEPEKKSRIISVESMRATMKTVYETAYEGGWKVCIFVGADCLNAAAANAFLKTLEEPPEKTLFLLLTDSPQQLLPTIISRCQHITINEGNSDGLDETDRAAVTEILAGYVGSGIMDGISKAEQLMALLKKMNDRIKSEESLIWHDERVALGMDEKEIKKSDDALDARISSRYREMRQAVMRSVLLWYRDILLLTCGADRELVFHHAQLDRLMELAQSTSYRKAQAQVNGVEEMNKKLGRNMPEVLVFTDGLIM